MPADKSATGRLISPLSTLLRDRARAGPTRVVLPEGDDPRVLRAAEIVAREGIASPILLGARRALTATSSELGVQLTGLTWYDPGLDVRRVDLATRYRTARRGGVSDGEAMELMADPLHFGTMLVQIGAADGLVAGARTTTSDVIGPALAIRRMVPGLGPISSCFLMGSHAASEASTGDGVLVFADCALHPAPSPAMVAQIAIAAARACRDLCGLEPRIALLSSSTLGSASHEASLKMSAARDELRRRAPELSADGELQADAALVPEVAQQKAPHSPVAGRANVLVFPDLESGNIAYKLVERLAGLRAVGPLFSGLNFPVNDLSRGCSVEDVIDVIAVTSIQGAGAVPGRGS